MRSLLSVSVSLVSITLITLIGCKETYTGPGAAPTPQSGKNTLPVAPATAQLSVSEDESGSFTVRATDADGDTLEYSIIESPKFGTLTHSGNSFSYMPNRGFFGDDAAVIGVSDGKGTSKVSAAIKVSRVVNAPRCELTANHTSIKVGEEVELSLKVTGDYGAILLDGAPADAQSYQTKKPLVSSKYSAVVLGVDGNSSCEVTVTVTNNDLKALCAAARDATAQLSHPASKLAKTYITSYQDLVNAHEKPGHYVLSNDIVVPSLVQTHLLNLQDSILDGNCYRLNQVRYNSSAWRNDSDMGILRQVGDSLVKNLILDQADIKGRDRIGVLAGSVVDSLIANVHVQGKGVGLASSTGLLLGEAIRSKILYSSARGSITVGGSSGGLVGSAAESEIAGSFAVVNMLSPASGVARVGGVGGLIGHAGLSQIKSSAANGVIGKLGDRRLAQVGGLVGDGGGNTLSDSYASVDIFGDAGLGGLMGRTESVLAKPSSIVRSSATGYIAGQQQIGGLIGDAYEANISSSFYAGQIGPQAPVADPDPMDYAGGLAGRMSGGKIESSFALGKIKARSMVNQVGGLVGELAPRVVCTRTIEVMAPNGSKLSICGTAEVAPENYGTLSRSFALVDFEAETSFGGFGNLVGRLYGNAVDSFALGNIGTSVVGKIYSVTNLGCDSYQVKVDTALGSPIYSLACTKYQTVSLGTLARVYSTKPLTIDVGDTKNVKDFQPVSISTIVQAVQESSYANWDLKTVWKKDGGELPYLRWMSR